MLREIDDLHRVAHLEHEHLAAHRQLARADDQLHRFGDRHEVARHPRVGDRDRPALRDLARKIGTTDPDEPSTLPKRTDE